MITTLPKAELHVHLDGTLTPQLVRELSLEKKIQLDPYIFSADGTQFIWRDFSEFHHVFNEAFRVIRNRYDYQLITYRYLMALAKQQGVYAELIVSPYHAELNQVPYEEMLRGIIAGIDQARLDSGIEARILMVFIRQHGPENALNYAQQVFSNQHPYVVGINLVGDIKQYEIKAFDKIFDRARGVGLGLSCHAGEIDGGPEEIWQAVDILGVQRVSHGVRCVEDPQLVAHLLAKNIVLEVCPTSNIILKMYRNYQEHPLRQLKQLGLKLTLNTDDPGFFNIDLNHEYQMAHQYGQFSQTDLLQCTRQAIEAGFADALTKKNVLKLLG